MNHLVSLSQLDVWVLNGTTVDALGTSTPPLGIDRCGRGCHLRYLYCLFARMPTKFLISHLELHVKTVKYFKSIEYVQEQVEKAQKELQTKGEEGVQVGSME